MIDIEEIRDARFMSMLSVADSPQAKEFVEGLIVLLKSKEIRKHQAPCFPVHDAIIVRKKDEELAKNILAKEFEAHANITPRLKLK